MPNPIGHEYPTLEEIQEEAKTSVYARLLIRALRVLAETAQPYPTNYATQLNALVYEESADTGDRS